MANWFTPGRPMGNAMDDQLAQYALAQRLRESQQMRDDAEAPIQTDTAGGQVIPLQWTQGLAKALKAYGANKLESDALDQSRAYARAKRDRLAAAVSGGDLSTPEGQEQYARQLIGTPETTDAGVKLLMDAMQKRRTAALLQQFGYGAQGANAQPGVAASPGGFDERRYAAMLESGDPILAKLAESYRAEHQIKAGDAQAQRWKEYTYQNPSAYQNAQLGIQGGNLAVNQARLANDTARLNYETGGGMPPTQPGAPASPPPQAIPQFAPTQPTAPAAAQPGRPLPPKAANEVEAARQKGENALAIEKQKLQPKAFAALQDYNNQADVTTAAIDRAINTVSGWTAGGGSLLKNMPASDARALENEISTIRSNQAINALTAMRQSSPTGGALGNVTEGEERLLASLQGSIDQGVKPKQLVEQLKRLREQVVGGKDRVRNAFYNDFGQGGMSGTPNFDAKKPGVKKWNEL